MASAALTCKWLRKISGEVKGRREEGKTAIITSRQWGENVPWSASSSFFFLLHFSPLSDFLFYLRFFFCSSPNIFGTRCPKQKQGRDRARSPVICLESVSHRHCVNTNACGARSPLPCAHAPHLHIHKKAPLASPQPHQHTPAWLRGKGVRACRRAPGPHIKTRHEHANAGVFLRTQMCNGVINREIEKGGGELACSGWC